MHRTLGKTFRSFAGAAALSFALAGTGASADEKRDQSLAPPSKSETEAQIQRERLDPNQIEDQDQINRNGSGYDSRGDIPLSSEGDASADPQEAPGRDEDLKRPDRAYTPDAVSSYRWGPHGGENVGIDLHEEDNPKIGVQPPAGPPPDARDTPPGQVVVQPPVDSQY